DFLEGALKIFARVFEIAGKPLFVGADHTGRRTAKSFPVRVVPGPLDERPDGGLGRCPRRPFVLAARTFCQATTGFHAELPASSTAIVKRIPRLPRVCPGAPFNQCGDRKGVPRGGRLGNVSVSRRSSRSCDAA